MNYYTYAHIHRDPKIWSKRFLETSQTFQNIMCTKKTVITKSPIMTFFLTNTRCVSNKTFPTKLHKKLAIILKIYIKNKKNPWIRALICFLILVELGRLFPLQNVAQSVPPRSTRSLFSPWCPPFPLWPPWSPRTPSW